jgi:hypothetical protein
MVGFETLRDGASVLRHARLSFVATGAGEQW